MTHNGYRYEVLAKVSFSLSEVSSLRALAKTHYDAKCREAANEAGKKRHLRNGSVVIEMQNGFLTIMEMTFVNQDPPVTSDMTMEFDMPFRQLDTIGKILESPAPWMPTDEYKKLTPLWASIHRILNGINEEVRRLNP